MHITKAVYFFYQPFKPLNYSAEARDKQHNTEIATTTSTLTLTVTMLTIW